MKIDKNRKLKGSVLLTVVAVMALLIIFMASTVTLATAANNRSHANYSDSQAEYTARAAIEGFSQALTLNDDLANGVLAMKDIGDTFTPSVVINNPGMGNVGYYEGKNWVPDKIKVEYVKDNMGYDKDKDCWEPMQVLKITATAKVGKQEKSLCCYLERSGESSDTQNNSIKGFQTLGGGGMQNNGSFSGALCLGLGNPDEDPIKKTPYLYPTRNDFNASITDGFVNGSQLQASGCKFVWNVPSSDSHYVVTRDFGLGNDGLEININYPYSKTNNAGAFVDTQFTQKDIPYLYVGGRIMPAASEWDNNTHELKSVTWANGLGVLNVNNSVQDNIRGKYYRAPFNIFAGSIELSNMKLEGTDLYLFDEETDTVSYTCGSDNIDLHDPSNLFKWSSSVLNRTETQFRSEGGSIYCNHNLSVNKKPLTVAGNLVVEGNLNVYQSVTVEGDLVVNGKINDMSKITCHGDIYYNGDGSADPSSNVYARKNTPAVGGLKPDVVQVTNKAYGGIYVPSVVVPNIPRYGDTSNYKYEENYPEPGYVELHFYADQSSGWAWDVAEEGYENKFKDHESDPNYFNNEIWGNASKYGLTQDEVPGMGKYMTIYAKVDSDKVITDFTGKVKYYHGEGEDKEERSGPYSYFYKNDDGEYVEIEDVSTISDMYVAGPDGNPVEPKKTTTSAVTKYKVVLAKNDEGEIEAKVTDTVTEEDGTYFKVNYKGEPTTDELTDSSVGIYYYKVDPATDEVVNEPATSPVSYYSKSGDTYTEITEAEAKAEVSANTYYAWYDSTKVVPEEVFYYKADPTGHEGDEAWHNANRISEGEAKTPAKNLKYRPIATYGGVTVLPNGKYKVYPKNMTWAGLNSGSTKIVKQLSEAIADIGGDPTVTRAEPNDVKIIPDGSYNSNFDITSITNELDITGRSGNFTIDRDTIVKCDTLSNGVTITVKARSNMFIVLDDVNFDKQVDFVVEGKDTVNFLLNGTVDFSVGGGIYTKKIYDAIKAGAVYRVNESDKMNINMYGKKDSKLKICHGGGNSLFCACAKCPFTTIDMATTNGVGPDVQYVDSYNHITTIKAPNWIGSGLFYSATGLSNNFHLIYTNSSDDNASNIHNNNVAGASWRIKYYDGY